MPELPIRLTEIQQASSKFTLRAFGKFGRSQQVHQGLDSATFRKSFCGIFLMFLCSSSHFVICFSEKADTPQNQEFSKVSS